VNRSEAKLLREYLQLCGGINKLKSNLREEDVNIMAVACSSAFSQFNRATVKLEGKEEEDEPGSDCRLVVQGAFNSSRRLASLQWFYHPSGWIPAKYSSS